MLDEDMIRAKRDIMWQEAQDLQEFAQITGDKSSQSAGNVLALMVGTLDWVLRDSA